MLEFQSGRCAQGRNRTADTRIFSPLLYRLSYLGKRCEVEISPKSIIESRFLTMLQKFSCLLLDKIDHVAFEIHSV